MERRRLELVNKWLTRAQFSTKLLTLICFKLTYIGWFGRFRGEKI